MTAKKLDRHRAATNTPYWTRAINTAIKLRAADPYAWELFSFWDIDLAHDWPTCACGKQSKRIPRDSAGKPIDSRLVDAGRRFMVAVANQNPFLAKTILAEIERHAARVLRVVEGSKFLALGRLL